MNFNGIKFCKLENHYKIYFENIPLPKTILRVIGFVNNNLELIKKSVYKLYMDHRFSKINFKLFFRLTYTTHDNIENIQKQRQSILSI